MLDKGRRYEEVLARRLGVKRNIASGALFFRKGDILFRNFLVECKYTDSNSFSIKLDVWRKTRKEALQAGRIPAMAININGTELLVLDINWLKEIEKDENDESTI